jgi:hypothetical protein
MNEADSTTHFHIHWRGKPESDHYRFSTRDEAKVAAEYLAQPGEKYSIEQRGAGCRRCAEVIKNVISANGEPK